MKKTIIIVILFCFMILTKEGYSKNIVQVEDFLYITEEWQWVDVMNPDPVKSGNGSFVYGDTCGIEGGGKITVVALDGNKILVEYTTNEIKRGTPCPSGILFFIGQAEFLRIKRIQIDAKTTQNSYMLELKKKKDHIRRLLK